MKYRAARRRLIPRITRIFSCKSAVKNPCELYHGFPPRVRPFPNSTHDLSFDLRVPPSRLLFHNSAAITEPSSREHPEKIRRNTPTEFKSHPSLFSLSYPKSTPARYIAFRRYRGIGIIHGERERLEFPCIIETARLQQPIPKCFLRNKSKSGNSIIPARLSANGEKGKRRDDKTVFKRVEAGSARLPTLIKNVNK